MLYRDFIDAGYACFPLWAIAPDGSCTCHAGADCKVVGKHPWHTTWASTTPYSDEHLATLERLGVFDTGYGVLCRGLLVVDVDDMDDYARLVEVVPEVQGAGLIVTTGGGGRHLFFKAPANMPLVTKLKDFPKIDFKSSGFVVGAGSLHKSGKRYELVYGDVSDIDDAPAALIAMLHRPEKIRAEIDNNIIDIDDDSIADMVTALSPDCGYDEWVKVGMAIHHATGGAGFALWDNWSRGGKKYRGIDETEYKWSSFGKSSTVVTLATLWHFAVAAGWTPPVTFTPTIQFEIKKEQDHGIDLLRPSGMVGDLVNWINSQCRYPREHLAVTAALTAIGNIAGLRYTDDIDGVTANLFSFCIAGSATGKESILSAVAEIHRVAGVAAATHGSIKSEQELTRNLIRHQASFYLVDEIGIFLTKVKNAQQRGGAAYLDGVIGLLMSSYSKAAGFMMLTGDAKDDLRQSLQRELAKVRKDISENEPVPAGRKEQLERAISQVDNGLERPFVSLMGFTTPSTFEDLVDFDNATNGFIGRSVLVIERENNPRAKRQFKKQDMPQQLQNAIRHLATGGAYNMCGGGRVEFYDTPQKIMTTADAAAALEQIQDYFYELAENHKEKTGLEAIARRAYELVSKISLILSIPSGVRTIDFVNWAFEFVKRDVNDKCALAFANMAEKTQPHDSLCARILTKIDHDTGMTTAQLASRMKKPKDAIEKALATLQKTGDIFLVTTENVGNNKRALNQWFRVRQ